MKYVLKPKAYLRYGDDFIVIESLGKLEEIRRTTAEFLKEKLKLKLHPRNNIIIKPQHGLKFLGEIIYPKFHKLNKRNQKKIIEKLNLKNAGSYYGMAKKHGDIKLLKEMSWRLVAHDPGLPPDSSCIYRYYPL